MKRSSKIMLATVAVLFLFPVVASGLPQTAYNFYNPDGEIGAIVYADKISHPSIPDGFRYEYYVENVNFNPDVGECTDTGVDPISAISIPIAIPMDPPLDWVGSNTEDHQLRDVTDIVYYPPVPYLGTPDLYRFEFAIEDDPSNPGILEGESSEVFYIDHLFDEGEAFSTLFDHGGSIDQDIITAMIAPDGGAGEVPVSDPVPEPATLLLLGSGLLGMAGLRRLITTKR